MAGLFVEMCTGENMQMLTVKPELDTNLSWLNQAAAKELWQGGGLQLYKLEEKPH